MSPDGQTDKDQRQRVFNLTLASVAGQVGCLTTVFIVAALLAGLWLDARFETKPLFTLILLLGSVPVTIIAMFRVAYAATARIKPAGKAGPRGQEGKPIGSETET